MVRNSENSHVNMSIPSHLVGQITEYMNVLTVTEPRNNNMSNEINTSDEEVIKDEVCHIYGHRKTSTGEFEFKIGWVNGGVDWVADSECNCEFLINRYLHSKEIYTNYLVCRVSTKEQSGGTHVSLEAQEEELKNSISHECREKHRIKVVKISASAYKSIPRELQIIAESCNMFDSIFIYRVDRLSRNIVKYLEWLEYFEGMGVNVIAVSEGLTYKENKLEFIKAVVSAQEESELIGKRVRLSIKQRLKRGDTCVGALPYGKKYKTIRVNGNIVRKCVIDHPDETKIIQSIKNSRKDCKTLMHELNNSGIKKRGRKWSLKMVQQIKRR